MDKQGITIMTEQNQLPRIKPFRPSPKGKTRLILVLVGFFLILGIFIFFRSPLAEIKSIQVKGNVFTSQSAILAKADLHVGDSYFGFRSGAVTGRINQISGMQSSRVERTFPGKITLVVTEKKIAGYQVIKGQPEVLLDNGKVLPMTVKPQWVDRPLLSDWEKHPKQFKALCKVLSTIKTSELADLSEIKPMATEAYPDKILIYTRSSFEVVTTVSKLKEKLPFLANVIKDLNSKGQKTGRITMLEANTAETFVNNSQ
jgi:cell division protein FtsQ